MALDEALLEEFLAAQQRGETPPPILRFFGWQPACLSLGYAQKVEREVDLAGCERLGIDWVRRPTGGRAILHETSELTYSLVAATDDPLLQGGILESYRKISEALLAGLQRLGVGAEAAGDEQRKVSRNPATAACFDAPSAYEITSNGRKVIGSAQARRGNALLQQGTILLTVDVARLFTALKPPPRLTRETAIAQVESRLNSLSAALGRDISYAEAETAFIAGFAEHFKLNFSQSQPTPAETARTNNLVTEKYANPAWNMTRQRPAPVW